MKGSKVLDWVGVAKLAGNPVEETGVTSMRRAMTREGEPLVSSVEALNRWRDFLDQHPHAGKLVALKKASWAKVIGRVRK